ncbi:hypothetical protein FOQG_18083 [Fusarium oxysporum f. sp. raphani 54005]|uniref:Uncharacterized protein n=2 Tax=Fusarium oxysporum TaxID=5507 RepID=X0BFH4_FUSOX|nr:hypothetical protein FOVG_17140 [Fusarium oxysporum f. sp. pisi HDV247]EXK77199.1 hypothetical protein FOQG_18083 [Fusarium oxysporum f. sp. raphani 54005]
MPVFSDKVPYSSSFEALTICKTSMESLFVSRRLKISCASSVGLK